MNFQEIAKEKAREIYQHVETALGEVGEESAQEFIDTGNHWDDKAVAFFKDAKKRGVSDLGGAYADHMYNDPDTVSDLMGDKIYDAAGGKKEGQIEIHDALQELYGQHTHWANAITKSRELIV